MAANVIYDNVVQPLRRLVTATFGPRLRLYLQSRYENRGSTFMLIRPLTDEEVVRDGFASTYQYRFDLRLYRRVGGDLGLLAHMDAITQQVEDVKHMIANNRSYSESGTYRWHSAVIESVNYTPDLSEEELADTAMSVVSFDLTVQVTAII